MTKINILFLSLVLIIITVACGGPSVPESVTLKVTQSEVYGDNSEYFSVVQGEYKLKCSDRVRMKIRLRLEKHRIRKSTISTVRVCDLRTKTV